MCAGVTGNDAVTAGGVFVTGGVASATGGNALVSGATLVMGLESAIAGAGTTGAGFAAFTVLSVHPTAVSAQAHAATNKPISALDFWLGIDLSFFFCKRLTEIPQLASRLEGTSQRQVDSERSAASELRLEFYLTIVNLHKSKGVGESDAGTAGAGGKEKLENLHLILRRNPLAGIRHRDLSELTVAPEAETNAPGGRREFRSVEQQVQHRLMHELLVEHHRREDRRKLDDKIHERFVD